MIVEAEDLREAQHKAAAARSPMLLWRVTKGDLRLRGVGPDLYVEAQVDVANAVDLYVAAPTAVTGAWLKGQHGPVTIEIEGAVLTLSTDRAAIGIGVVTQGEEIAKLANWPVMDDLEPLGLTGELWEAMAAVNWASGADQKSVSDERHRSVHFAAGQVWAFAPGVGRAARVEVDLPDADTLPMVPTSTAALGAMVHPNAMVAVDPAQRLWVIEDRAIWVAPTVGGDRLPPPFAAKNLRVPIDEGVSTELSRKALLDALDRLDRVDEDDAAKRSSVRTRVQLRTIEDGLLGLSVLVGEQKATEAIDCAGAAIDMVFSLPVLKSLVGFAIDDEVELRHKRVATASPVYLRSGPREAWVMGLAEKELRHG